LLRTHYTVSEAATQRVVVDNRIVCVVDFGTHKFAHRRVGVRVVGGDGGEGPPGPIPNPVAKLPSADGTALDRVWESKTPPTHTLREGSLFFRFRKERVPSCFGSIAKSTKSPEKPEKPEKPHRPPQHRPVR
jgi:hypothetical protein